METSKLLFDIPCIDTSKLLLDLLGEISEMEILVMVFHKFYLDNFLGKENKQESTCINWS